MVGTFKYAENLEKERIRDWRASGMIGCDPGVWLHLEGLVWFCENSGVSKEGFGRR